MAEERNRVCRQDEEKGEQGGRKREKWWAEVVGEERESTALMKRNAIAAPLMLNDLISDLSPRI